MLLMGFMLRNIPVITDGVYIEYRWSASLRNIALAVILARAGLGLDPSVCHILHYCIYPYRCVHFINAIMIVILLLLSHSSVN